MSYSYDQSRHSPACPEKGAIAAADQWHVRRGAGDAPSTIKSFVYVGVGFVALGNFLGLKNYRTTLPEDNPSAIITTMNSPRKATELGKRTISYPSIRTVTSIKIKPRSSFTEAVSTVSDHVQPPIMLVSAPPSLKTASISDQTLEKIKKESNTTIDHARQGSSSLGTGAYQGYAESTAPPVVSERVHSLDIDTSGQVKQLFTDLDLNIPDLSLITQTFSMPSSLNDAIIQRDTSAKTRTIDSIVSSNGSLAAIAASKLYVSSRNPAAQGAESYRLVVAETLRTTERGRHVDEEKFTYPAEAALPLTIIAAPQLIPSPADPKSSHAGLKIQTRHHHVVPAPQVEASEMRSIATSKAETRSSESPVSRSIGSPRETWSGIEFEVSTRVRGKPAGKLVMLIANARLDYPERTANELSVKLSDIIALLSSRMGSGEVTRLMSSTHAQQYITLNDLRSSGISVSFDDHDHLVFNVAH